MEKLEKLRKIAEEASDNFQKANTPSLRKTAYAELCKARNAYQKAKQELYKGSGVLGNSI